MPNYDIMSIREMIDIAFGQPNVNKVNFKLIQTILFILARQLRVLERRVEIEIGPGMTADFSSGSSLSITEVKMHATVPKGQKKAIKGTGQLDTKLLQKIGMGKPADQAKTDKRRVKGGKEAPSTSEKTSSEPTSTDQAKLTFSDQVKSSDVTSSKLTSSEVTSSALTSSKPTSSEITSSKLTETSSKKTSSEVTSSKLTEEDVTSSELTTEVTSSQLTTTGLTSSELTSSGLTSSKLTTDETTSKLTTLDESSSLMTSLLTSSKITESDPSSKVTSLLASSTLTKSEPSSQLTTDQISSVLSPSELSSKLTSELLPSSKLTSTEVISSLMTASEPSSKLTSHLITSSIITPAESSSKLTSTAVLSSLLTSEQTSSTLTLDPTTTTELTSSQTYTDTEENKANFGRKSNVVLFSAASKKVPNAKSKIAAVGDRRPPTVLEDDDESTHSQEVQRLWDDYETAREKVLRVIKQRADSREEPDKEPSPMRSVTSLAGEIQHEKLLIVERVGVPQKAPFRSDKKEKSPHISVVTKERFDNLAQDVRELEKKFQTAGTPEFPENAQLMEELRRGASLTDAMAALQLSARLEAAEKALRRMMGLVTALAKQMPGVDIQFDEVELNASDYEGLDGQKSAGVGKKKGKSSQMPPAIDGRPAFAQPPKRKSVTKKGSKALGPQSLQSSDEESVKEVNLALPQTVASEVKEKVEGAEELGTTSQIQRSHITERDLNLAMQALYDDIMKSVKGINIRNAGNADTALALAKGLEGKLNLSLQLGTRMEELENMVSDYTQEINAMDTGISSQMTNYQEQLTQMSHELEIGLENMAETLANVGGDPVAVAELNAKFTNFQNDLDNTTTSQKELNEVQTQFELDLKDLLQKIELLRETKSDRDEVADALKDKAGIGQLNGLVTQEQFDAVRGDLEKRILAAYDKFNNQEHVWQKAIDELIHELNAKADWVQLNALRDDINNNIGYLKSKILALAEIVGEPRAAAVSRKMFRDTECLACATPAKMEMEESRIPALPSFGVVRPRTIGAEMPRESGDHKPCYPGYPIPHPRDPRAEFCTRFCGGSHTVTPAVPTKAPMGIIVGPILRNTSTAVGSDGKAYKTDEITYSPCIPCNRPEEKAATAQDTEPADVPQSGAGQPAVAELSTSFTPFSDLMMGSALSGSLNSKQYLDDERE